jgi:hypothetical protein
VERSLAVLDAAVLVVSAVEGVQPQTVVLWRELRRLGVPCAVFINKIDRQGANPAGVRAEIGRRLAAGSGALLLPLTDVLTGAGVPGMLTTLPRVLPWARPANRDLSGVIYKIEHGDHGTLPTRSVQPLLAQLPELTSGEGVFTSEVTRYTPVAGPPPARPRNGPDPLDRQEWFRARPR